MKDFLGRELNIGDEVVYLSHSRTSSRLYKAIITGFTPMKVHLDTYSEDGRKLWVETKYPRHIVKVTWSEVLND